MKFMDYFLYFVFIIITLFFFEFIIINLGGALGSGPYEIGLVVTGISVMCTLMIFCTIAIIKAIKNNNK